MYFELFVVVGALLFSLAGRPPEAGREGPRAKKDVLISRTTISEPRAPRLDLTSLGVDPHPARLGSREPHGHRDPQRVRLSSLTRIGVHNDL